VTVFGDPPMDLHMKRKRKAREVEFGAQSYNNRFNPISLAGHSLCLCKACADDHMGLYLLVSFTG